MKNLFKKISAILIAAVMVLAMASTAFAATETSVEHATVKGVTAETNADGTDKITVKAYKIIQFNQEGTYTPVLSGTITETNGELTPTAKDLQALSLRTEELGNPVAFTKLGEDYICNTLDPGTWMILVEGSEKSLYNPAIISVQQTPSGKLYGTLDYATDTWTDVGGVVYAKKSTPTITKTASKEKASDTEVIGTQYGDIIKYTIVADIPSYKSNEATITYSIKDELDGLALVVDKNHPVTATVNGGSDNDLTAAVTAAVTNNETQFEVNSLSKEWIIAHKGQQITITYFAKVTSTEMVAVDLNTNTAKLEYSANNKIQSKTSQTKHYTFGIDTKVNGTTETGLTGKTGEFVKVNEDGEVGYVESSTGIVKKTEKTEYLSGAKFKLHIGTADGPVFKCVEFETDENGRLEINGLDSDVTYYLVETVAPTGYKLNATPIKVKVDANYDNNGTLISYSVKIGDKNGNPVSITHYNYNETQGKVEIVNTKETASNPMGFQNTKLSTLPSTGGMGTYLFTIIGVVVMAGAAGAFFISRRKGSEE